MLFKRTKKYVYISVGCLSLYAGLANAQSNISIGCLSLSAELANAQTNICVPSDPFDYNSGNLRPSHPSGSSSESFHKYTGRPSQA